MSKNNSDEFQNERRNLSLKSQSLNMLEYLTTNTDNYDLEINHLKIKQAFVENKLENITTPISRYQLLNQIRAA